jgi:predicted flap endonuclease-1-like 5' DNA nuclease
MNWCILIPLLVGAICAILGYLLGRLLGGGNQNECEERVANLQAELDACKSSKISLEGDLKSTKSSLASSVAAEASAKSSLELTKASLAASLSAPAPVVSVFDAAAAKAVFGKKIKEDDLTVVEGIGPKIQGLFHEHDVKTWKALSECSIEKCQAVLDSGGERYKIHRPGTWPKQAGLAAEGKWEELLKWQDELDGGK